MLELIYHLPKTLNLLFIYPNDVSHRLTFPSSATIRYTFCNFLCNGIMSALGCIALKFCLDIHVPSSFNNFGNPLILHLALT